MEGKERLKQIKKEFKKRGIKCKFVKIKNKDIEDYNIPLSHLNEDLVKIILEKGE